MHKYEKLRGSNSVLFNKGFAADELKHNILDLLKAHFEHHGDGHIFCNTAAMFHGCSLKAALAITRTGAADLRTTDGGFFGAGIYTTPFPEYAATYSTTGSDDAGQRERCMVFAKVAVANTYPITRMTDYNHPEAPNAVSKFDYRHPLHFDEATQQFGPPTQRSDKALEPGYDSHFVAIRAPAYQAVDDPRPSDMQELLLKEPGQVCDARSPATHHRIPVLCSQVLPVARLYFRQIIGEK